MIISVGRFFEFLNNYCFWLFEKLHRTNGFLTSKNNYYFIIFLVFWKLYIFLKIGGYVDMYLGW
jgi:hypothetical protein